MITFTKVRLPYGWLSNMSPHRITVGDVVWPTAEHLFQALRFAETHPIREEIRRTASPMAAKFIMKANVAFRIVTPHSERDLDHMRMCLRLKVEQHPDIRDWILATGDEVIVEDCTSRQRASGMFWGMGQQSDGTWKGQNALGVLWMELREALRKPVEISAPGT